ncbi:hypothetical protein NMG60_11026927 [Bertholletia excelsa]
MGCASSKQIDVAAGVYLPPPSSFAVFDINSIKEPWLMPEDAAQQDQDKPATVPQPILDKLNKLESDGPRSWDEISKALEDLKPTITNPTPPQPKLDTVVPVRLPAHDSPATDKKSPEAPRKRFSFHTLEELDAKLAPKPPEQKTEPKKNDRVTTEAKKIDPPMPKSKPDPAIESEAYKPVRENIFLVRDRLEREREGKAAPPARWNPLNDFPEKCPPKGADAVVLYTTSLGGIRRTCEDCHRVKAILENHQVVFDERDVSLHGEFLSELKGLVGDSASVPRLFVKGRYIGGAEEVVGLNETGRLGRMMSWARVERGVGRQGCEGCGGARFVPCWECGGSCKVYVGESRERCPECNENGLVQCPACL